MGTSVEYQQAHAGDDISRTIIAVNASMLVLAYIAVTLRFYSRYLIGAPVLADDWMIIVATIFTTGHIIGDLVSVHYGFGIHVIFIQDPSTFAKTLLSAESIYNFAIPAIKFSVLLLYRRLFPQKSFHRILWGVAAFICCYSLTQMLTFLLQCIPLESIWNKAIGGECIDIGTVLIFMSTLNVITDVVLLCLPIPALWSLKLSAVKRLQLIGVFLLGGLVCIISIVRATYVARVSTTDPSWDDADAGIWSAIELCVAIVSACLPTLRPLYNVLRHGGPTTNSLTPFSGRRSHALDYDPSQTRLKSTGKPSIRVKSWVPGVDPRAGPGGPFEQLGEMEGDGVWEMREIQHEEQYIGTAGILHEMGSRTSLEEHELRKMELGAGIVVTRTVTTDVAVGYASYPGEEAHGTETT